MSENYQIKALNTETWSDFEQLAEKHHGVWGGCWCTYFHEKLPRHERSAEANQCYKKQLVEAGKAHAALVFNGSDCVAWCQFGSPEELPSIYHKKEVESKMDRPDWRITCFFVDKNYRRQGLSGIALNAAVELIRGLGGGIIESYPQDTQGQKVSSNFLYNGTRQIFEQAGFDYLDTKGKNHCIMRKTV